MVIKRVLTASIFLCLTGCVTFPVGLIYSDTVSPLDKNMNNTPNSPKEGDSQSFYVRLPLTNTPLSAEWNSRAIADAAKAGNLSHIDYADMRTQSILLGLWKKQEARVYGTENPKKQPDTPVP